MGRNETNRHNKTPCFAPCRSVHRRHTDMHIIITTVAPHRTARLRIALARIVWSGRLVSAHRHRAHRRASGPSQREDVAAQLALAGPGAGHDGDVTVDSVDRVDRVGRAGSLAREEDRYRFLQKHRIS